MHDKIFPKAAIEAKHRRGLLGTHFDCFVNWMQQHGYSRNSMRVNIQCVTHFGKYLERRGICSIYQLEGVEGQKLLAAYQRYFRRRGYWRRDSGLKLYLRALEEAGVIAPGPSKDFLLFHETRRYIVFLKSQRGLHESTIRYHIYYVEKFLHFVGYQKDTSSLPAFGIADIDKFIAQEAFRRSRSSQQQITGVLRSFLRFLYQSGRLSTDLASLIINPRRYKLETLPRVLDWGEVQKILDSVDRSKGNGPQHHAILILLTTYGLRAGEVANLKLEDIDWRKETIRIVPRKNGKDLWLPLIPQVGKAILEYLKHGRPPSKYREIFLIPRAPWTPMKSINIGLVVRRYIQLSGLDLPRGRAHLLRHSFATHLIRKGVSLKQIGDMLGHREPESTHIYTKTATEQLREVALEVPEVR